MVLYKQKGWWNMEILRGEEVPELIDRVKWPFGQMAVGDCVRVSREDGFTNARASVQYASRPSGKRPAKAFATRTIDGVLHVWRVA